MTANYWDSTQRQNWQYTKEQLGTMRTKMLMWEKQRMQNTPLTVRYDTNMRIYIHQMIAKLGRRMMLRQLVLATAEVYIARFSTKVSFLEYNLYMLIATSVYLACKVCEAPQHIRTVVSEARNCWPDFISADFTKLAEFEFYLIEELECYMIVHHPYQSLTQLVDVLGRQDNTANISMQRNSKYRLNLSDIEIENTWKVINDCYMTDLPLLYPPHIIAIAALQIVLILGWDTSEMDGRPIDCNELKKPSLSLPGSNTRIQESLGSFSNDQTNKSMRASSSSSPSKITKPAIRVSNASVPAFPDDMNSYFNLKPPTPRTQNPQTTNRSTTPKQSQPTINNVSRQTNANPMKTRTLPVNSTSLRRKLSHSLPKPRVGVMQSSSERQSSQIPRPPRLECFINFLAGSNVNLEEVIESVQELLALYEAWQLYDESSVRQNLKFLIAALSNSNPA